MEIAFLCVIIVTAAIMALFVIPIFLQWNIYDVPPGRIWGIIIALFTVLVASAALWVVWSFGG